VEEPVLAWRDLEERAVVLDASNDALVLGSDLGLGREALDDFDRLLECFAIR